MSGLTTRLRIWLIIGIGVLCVLGGLATAASAATTCSTIAEVHHGTHLVYLYRVVHGKRVHVYRRETVIVHHRRKVVRVPVKVRRPYTTTVHVQVCETALISIDQASVPSTGGSTTIHYTSSNASSCTLSTNPAFWSGTNPAPVACDGTYAVTIPASESGRQWTFSFTARNRLGQSATSTLTLTQQAPPVPVTIGYSDNWSGYADVGGPFTQVQGTFNVPNLYVAPTQTDTSEWVGIDGATNSSLIQAGVREEYDPTTSLVYTRAWYEILPAPETPIPSLAVSTGDVVTVRIWQVSGSIWNIIVADDTTGQSYGTELAYTGPGASAEWIVEAPTVSGSIATLGDFTPNVTFDQLGVNGTPVGVDQLFMVQGGAVVSSPSAVSLNGFTVAYGPVPPPAP